jgi:peptidoglycan/LPS O-acetylase OafA/YrhL
MTSPQPDHSTATIAEFEGLRGILACWVMIGHWSTSIALSLRPLRQNLWDVQAVDVFIILSGFVITLLLHRAPTRYGRYITRRWFRIAPVFLTILLISAWLLPVTKTILGQAPVGEMMAVRQNIIADTETHFLSDLLWHLTMLHGLVPLADRQYAAYAFVGQAWSISLEWQFYLVAPLFFWLIRRARQPVAAVALVALAGGLMAIGSLFSPAYLGNKLPLFALGAGSYWLWHRYAATFLPLSVTRLRCLSGVLILLCLASRLDALLGPALWLAVFHCLLVARAQSATVEAKLTAVLRCPPLQFLGRISYTLYLVHFLVLIGGLALLQGLAETPHTFAFALLAYLVPASIAAAWLLSVIVERPLMALGRRLTQRAK